MIKLYSFFLIYCFIVFINCGAPQTQLWYDEQFIDHSRPQNNSTWSQRYWVIDEYYNTEKGPVILYICGEYTCPGLPEDRQWPADIAEMYEGLILVLEHRYYGKSMPFGKDSYELENLQYLSVEQALADLANFIGWVKENGKHGVSTNSPWFTIGGSYPGAMSAWFRYAYPHLTVGAIASSAVIHAIIDFPQFDEQIADSALRSGEWCAKAIHDLNFYAQQQVMDLLTSDDFKSQFEGGIHSTNGQFLFFYTDILVEKIQYSKRTWLCDQLKGLSVEEGNKFVVQLAKDEDMSITYYSSYYLSNTTVDDDGFRAWAYQYCTEFGFYQVAPEDAEISMRGTLVDIEMFTDLCRSSFGVDTMWPTADKVNLQYGGLDMQANNIVLTNGVEDPWKWAGLLQSRNDMLAIEIDCVDCAHCIELYTPKANDAPELKEARDTEVQEISRWLKQYNDKNGYSFNYQPKLTLEQQLYL